MRTVKRRMPVCSQQGASTWLERTISTTAAHTQSPGMMVLFGQQGVRLGVHLVTGKQGRDLSISVRGLGVWTIDLLLGKGIPKPPLPAESVCGRVVVFPALLRDN